MTRTKTVEIMRLEQDISEVTKQHKEELGVISAKNLAKRQVLAEQLERIRTAETLEDLRGELHAYLFVRDARDLMS